MILSMTGFAALAAELPGCSMSVELRSVNHRYLDIQLRLPDELRTLETAIRELLSSELKRGKVDCRIGLVRNAPGAAAERSQGRDHAAAHQSLPGGQTHRLVRWAGSRGDT